MPEPSGSGPDNERGLCGKEADWRASECSSTPEMLISRTNILSVIVKKNMCVARMQQGSHGKKLHASVDLGKVVRINYDNFHLFFLPVSDILFTNNYVM